MMVIMDTIAEIVATLRTLNADNEYNKVFACLKAISNRSINHIYQLHEKKREQFLLPDFNKFRALFQEFGRLNLGTLNGYRFTWNCSAHEVAQVALGESSTLDLTECWEAAPEHPAKIPATTSAHMHTHSYLLRPGLAITINLPLDLKPEEASRLAAFIQTLPMK